jgi:hypothetical protein
MRPLQGQADAGTGLAQHFVALFVAAGAVDGLEAIHAEEQHGAGTLDPGRTRHHFSLRGGDVDETPGTGARGSSLFSRTGHRKQKTPPGVSRAGFFTYYI